MKNVRTSGKRLVDVMDEKPLNQDFWKSIFAKMNQLLIKIESTNPSIDDLELRWVSDRIEYWNSDARILTPQEMQIANLYWKKYNLNKGEK
tara:strand:+ start:1593 stop:1865 length:273 start_codon:yes stop_codon:yes gene_type:complete